MAIGAAAAFSTRPAYAPPRSPSGEVVDIMRNLSKVRRRSREEGAMRALIISEKERINGSVWKGALTHATDKAGNLLVRVPGTGRFVNEASVALQSHLDMVEAVRGAKPDADLTRYFANGVEFERDGEWWYSKGKKTSAGFDDIYGVAISMRMLYRPELQHPPLELVFTVDEEVGFTGASGMELPLTSQVMINLDGERETQTYFGCQGASALAREIYYPGLQLKNGPAIKLGIILTGLKSGHSGGEIHLPRANSVALALETVYFASKLEGVFLKSFSAGDFDYSSRIPDSFSLELILDARAAPHIEVLRRRIRERLLSRLGDFSEENPDEIQIEVEQSWADNPMVLSNALLSSLYRTFKTLPNGVIWCKFFLS